MRILGIDPGPERSGVAIFDTVLLKVVSSGVIDNDAVFKLFDPAHVDRVAIEYVIGYGVTGRAVTDTAFWAGRFFECWETHRISIDPSALTIPFSEVKEAICHSSRATEANVREEIIHRFGKPGTKKQPGPTYGVTSHAWSALAIAVVCALRLGEVS